MGSLAQQVCRVHLDHLVNPAHLVRLVKQDLEEILDRQDLQAPEETLVHQDQMVSQAHLVRQGRRVQQDLEACQDREDLQELEVNQEQ